MNEAAPIQITIEQIGPQEAGAILERSYDATNRKLRPGVVKSYADAMRRGEWVLHHQGIALDEQGRLVDGQHRLYAIIESGCTVPITVTHGVPRDRFGAIDIGSKRSPADFLDLAGEEAAHTLSSALGWLWRETEGRLERGRSALTARPSNAQMAALLSEHPEIRGFVTQDSFREGRQAVIPPGIYAWLAYRLESVDADASAAFWEALRTGAGLEVDDARLQLRDRLRDGNRRTPKDVVALILKAWAMWRAGSTHRLSWMPGREVFPPLPWRTLTPEQQRREAQRQRQLDVKYHADRSKSAERPDPSSLRQNGSEPKGSPNAAAMVEAAP